MLGKNLLNHPTPLKIVPCNNSMDFEIPPNCLTNINIYLRFPFLFLLSFFFWRVTRFNPYFCLFIFQRWWFSVDKCKESDQPCLLVIFFAQILFSRILLDNANFPSSFAFTCRCSPNSFNLFTPRPQTLDSSCSWSSSISSAAILFAKINKLYNKPSRASQHSISTRNEVSNN